MIGEKTIWYSLRKLGGQSIFYRASFSIVVIFKRPIKVRSELYFMNNVLLYERYSRNIGPSFKLLDNFKNILSDRYFWKHIVTTASIFEQICTSIGFIESDACSMSEFYASFPCAGVHIIRRPELNQRRIKIENFLNLRWDRIYRPVHFLTFVSAPFYFATPSNFESVYGVAFVELKKGNLKVQCNYILNLFRSDENHWEKLMEDFLKFYIST